MCDLSWNFGFRTGPPGYIGWRNSFLRIGLQKRFKIRALVSSSSDIQKKILVFLHLGVGGWGGGLQQFYSTVYLILVSLPSDLNHPPTLIEKRVGVGVVSDEKIKPEQ